MDAQDAATVTHLMGLYDGDCNGRGSETAKLAAVEDVAKQLPSSELYKQKEGNTKEIIKQVETTKKIRKTKKEKPKEAKKRAKKQSCGNVGFRLTTLTKSWKVMAVVLRSCARCSKMSRLFASTSAANSGLFSTSRKSSHGISPKPSGSYCKADKHLVVTSLPAGSTVLGTTVHTESLLKLLNQATNSV